MAQGKTVAESRTEMTELVLPGDSNQLGNIFGGRIMYWVDMAAAMAANRHAGRVAVTASIDSVEFLHPIRIGEVVHLIAQVNWVGRTSMEVGVDVYGENMDTGERKKTSTAFLTFVALSQTGQPVEVPPLILRTPEEEERFHAAEARRQERLKKKQKASRL
ncbi:acyl-CoA thioesterase [Sulfobacillus harzensis]|uniref:acyl-CoA thioesterase n=1 Tax=Sulfobacillus harzensis TaxID=2729629 RepID=UPI003B838ACE